MIKIPEKIKVGYQSRGDTYTSKLGYVIYKEDEIWRKETSWLKWKNDEIPHDEFDNVPTSGFVLNKRAGGYGQRMEYARVYDPRGFEFEITIPNLLMILTYCDSVKGKALEGDFVYTWDNTQLVLMPVTNPEYAEQKSFNSKTSKISKKDYKAGQYYIDKYNNKAIYIGYYYVYHNGSSLGYENSLYNIENRSKKHIFAVFDTKDRRSYSIDFKPVIDTGEEYLDFISLCEVFFETYGKIIDGFEPSEDKDYGSYLISTYNLEKVIIDNDKQARYLNIIRSGYYYSHRHILGYHEYQLNITNDGKLVKTELRRDLQNIPKEYQQSNIKNVKFKWRKS